MNRNPKILSNDLLGLSQPEILAAIYSKIGDIPAYRGKQIYQWLHAKRARSFSEMTQLPADLRSLLDEQFTIGTISLAHRSMSEDGTIKFLFDLSDGFQIESVLIPSEMRDSKGEARRKTLCLSTQVGCPLDCKFCATASMKLKRNLTTSEILQQYFEVERLTGERITNVVYMGMGEPLLNYDNVVRSLRILTDPELDIIGSKRITVSTSGLPEEIRKFAHEKLGVKLALSLHATTDELRSKLMPINRAHPIKDLLEAMDEYYKVTGIPVTYEYILFEGLNDSDADARRLAKIARRLPSKVNVIPFHRIDFTNPVGIGAELHPATDEHFIRFNDLLRAEGVHVMVRSSSGEDIEAACGQLALSKLPHPIAIGI
ncbi:MAG: 23S rRNA (adenine(2503)-C(2))-methyltransferase RlmN [Bacteroidota bacterium]|nr:23S rRNA (adenine(2503)-C(2))-methyltransferase RlmN [Bacteroidota bacterium]